MVITYLLKKDAYFGYDKNIIIGDNLQLGINYRIDNDLMIGEDLITGPDVIIYTSSHEFDRKDIPINLHVGKKEIK